MKLGTSRSPKFKRLARAAGSSLAETVGHLELLWQCTAENAAAGDIGRWTDAEIEEECAWEGEPGRMVGAMLETGWLDPCKTHRIVVHDWADHAPEFIRKRLKRAGLEFVSLDPPDFPDDPRGSDDCGQHSHEDELSSAATDGRQRQTTADNGCPPSPTESNPTGSNRGESAAADAADFPTDPSPERRARDHWPALRDRAAKHGATWAASPGRKQVEIIAARLREGTSPDDLVRAIDGHVRRNQFHGDPLAHLTATTVFRSSHVDANVEASFVPEALPANAEREPPEQAKQRRTREAARAALDAVGEYDGTPDFFAITGGRSS